MSNQNPLDQVILVDSFDQQTGVMDKIEAHRGDGQRHRASSVFLFNEDGELLIQKRSQEKIVGAGQWANTCCGNVRPHETYQECALRRLREELGINDVKLRSLHKFEYHTKCSEEFSEFEIDTVFFGEYIGEVNANSDEVAEYKWVDTEKLLEEIANDKKNSINLSKQEYVPWFHILTQQKPVAALLQ